MIFVVLVISCCTPKGHRTNSTKCGSRFFNFGFTPGIDRHWILMLGAYELSTTLQSEVSALRDVSIADHERPVSDANSTGQRNTCIESSSRPTWVIRTPQPLAEHNSARVPKV